MSLSAPASAQLSDHEMVSALSTRLIHSLANHLAVVTGNLCVASALRDDPARAAAALRSAEQAGNDAGRLLNRFADFRRGLNPPSSILLVQDWIPALRALAAGHPGWAIAIDPALDPALETPSAARLAFSAPVHWLNYAFDQVIRASQAPEGAIHVSRINPAPSTSAAAAPAVAVQITFTCRPAAPIPWDNIRLHLQDWPLAAAYELLTQLGARPAARLLDTGAQETRCAFPAFPHSPPPPERGLSSPQQTSSTHRSPFHPARNS